MRGKKIVLDLEFIPYRRKQEPYCVHEIIEIGAVALDADNEIYDESHNMEQFRRSSRRLQALPMKC